MELIDIIDLVGLSQGVILGLAILINKPKGSKAFTYLGFYLIILGLLTAHAVLDDNDFFESHPLLYFLPVNLYFTFPVLLYLYAREISGMQSEGSWRKLLIPGAIEFIIRVVLLVLVIIGVGPDIDSDAFLFFEALLFLAAFVFMIYYLIKIIRFITKVRKMAENNYSSLTDRTLSWLRIACILILITFLFPIIDELIPGLYDTTYYLESTINAVTLFWLAINGYKQTVILNLRNTTDEVEPTKTKVIPLPADREKFLEIEQLIKERELFKKQELTLADLAAEAGIHTKQLSYLINQFAEKNFFNFINQYRVEEAQELLVAKEFEHLSFLGIAFEAGFNSKATFNATFKKLTGLTPRQYKLSRQSA